MENIEPEYVVESVKREYAWPWRSVQVYNMYGNKIYDKLYDDFPELLNLSVHKDKVEEAKELYMKFYDLGINPKKELALPIINDLLSVCEPSSNKISDLAAWNKCAIKLPGDIGGPNKEKFAEQITQRSKGKVLEAMAGFNTYVLDSPSILEVIALDYSKEMLLRYPVPERKRILFDLGNIYSKNAKMNFFQNNEFQTVTCCYGVNYLDNPKSVFKEFYRIISPEGKLLVLGNPMAGYSQLQKRPFDPENTAREIKESGFSSSIESFPELKSPFEMGYYFLVTGTK